MTTRFVAQGDNQPELRSVAPLRITCSYVAGATLCEAAGELDLATVGDLRAAVMTAARAGERLRLELSGVEFIDTTGLGALLELRSSLQAAGVAFEITATEGSVRQAVQITGLAHLLAAT
jgi:anti-sigma B factor antagonist